MPNILTVGELIFYLQGNCKNKTRVETDGTEGISVSIERDAIIIRDFEE